MLRHLYINNYTLIGHLDIDLHEGFSVITGETGAGKSILLGALGLLLGQRADSKSIKAGEKKCVVEGTFDTTGINLETIFNENDIDFNQNECIIRRELTDQGKSRAFVNDTPVALSILREIGARLIDIHSQHQNLLMGNEGFLINTLDSLANNSDLLQSYRAAFEHHDKLRHELQTLTEQAGKDEAEREFLQFQLQQIDEARLQSDEQEALESEQEQLSHVEEIKTALYSVSARLNADEHNPINDLRNDAHTLAAISHVYAPAEELAERLESMRIELSDIAAEVESHTETVDFDPQRLQTIEQRLDTIYTLQRKFHVDTIDELLQQAEDFRKQLNFITHSDEIIAEKKQQLAQAEKAMLQAAKSLSQSRKTAAEKLNHDILLRVQQLGMPNAKLQMTFSPKQPAANGIDQVELLFSANKNNPPRNVSLVASGGEIARLMLALKSVIAKNKELATVIFDEIDTGVSGTMAEKMGQTMAQMASHCQVVCITHLPQIAALGTYHYRVLKTEDDVQTETHISLLTTEERIGEVANMLSGEQTTVAAISNAKELLGLTS